MDFVFSHKVAKEIVKRIGLLGFLEVLQFRFPHLDLYQVSSSWLDNPHYICKAKGTRGDLIINWFDFEVIENSLLDYVKMQLRISDADEKSEAALGISREIQPFELLSFLSKKIFSPRAYTPEKENWVSVDENAVTKK